ncbi:MAG: hypothetical protein H6733_08525 [Alphaproteobacteria bacterium]|nr:hypothetical protein [Alphaproteobacteria bacterium]
MNRTLQTLILATTLPGCIFFRSPGKFVHDDDDTVDRDTDVVDTDMDDTAVDTDVVDTDTVDTDVVDTDTDGPSDTDLLSPLSFDPDHAAVGDDTILVLSSEGVIDLSNVLEVRFFGSANVAVSSTRVQGDALLVAIAVPDDATPGVQDVLVRFTNGTGLWLEDVFTVTP